MRVYAFDLGNYPINVVSQRGYMIVEHNLTVPLYGGRARSSVT